MTTTMSSLLLALLSFSTAQAGSLEFGREHYLAMKARYQSDAAPIKERHARIAQDLNSQIDAKKAERNSCTTFDCAKEASTAISALEAAISANQQKRDLELQKMEWAYDLEGRQLVLETSRLALQEVASAIPGFKMLSDRGFVPCGFVRGNGDIDYTPFKDILCEQLQWDYKIGNYFYRLQLAYGVERIYTNALNGEFAPGNYVEELNGLDYIFLTTGLSWKNFSPDFFTKWDQRGFEFRSFGDGNIYSIGGRSNLGIGTVSIERQ